MAIRPPKPYETYPLFPHAKGYWAKKIDGRQVSFGKWAWPDEDDYEKSWRDALDQYQRYDADRARTGRVLSRPDRLTLGELADGYVAAVNAKFFEKRIGARHLADILRVVKDCAESIGKKITVGELERRPELLTSHIVDQNHMKWHTFNKTMAILNTWFVWAEHPIEGLLRRPFVLRPLLRKRPKKVHRRAKRESEAESGKKRWTPIEINAMLHASRNKPYVHAWILLGYFCAFGNSDISDLPKSFLNLDPPAFLKLPKGWGTIHFPRPKTEVDRAAVIPPMVVEALRAAMAVKRKPADGKFRQFIFLTRVGLPFVREAVDLEADGTVAKVTPYDQVANKFGKFRGVVWHCPDGHAVELNADGAVCFECRKALVQLRRLGFYTFRHTAITAASGTADVDAIHRWRGHALPGMSDEYVEEIEIHKLHRIAERLLERLSITSQSSGSVPASAASSAVAAAA